MILIILLGHKHNYEVLMSTIKRLTIIIVHKYSLMRYKIVKQIIQL